MAKVDDLLSNITDVALRQRLKEAVDEIKARRQFGLVFEHHIPETVMLPDTKPKKGMTVASRSGVFEGDWILEKIAGKSTCLRHPRTDEQRSATLDDLIVVKPFGEAIYPCLSPIGTISKGGARPWHTVIDGENYHAVQLLLYLYEGKVDCLYLDPPYNTGAKDWTYNNRFVDRNDSYRHSKWLSFMEKRLRFAKRLLKPDGVLITTIDEHEVLHLGMLLERLFPEFTRQMVTIVNNPKGVTQGGFSRVEEYAFFCSRSGARVEGRGDDLLTPDTSDDEVSTDEITKRPRWKGLLRSGTNARRQDRKKMFYPVLIDPERKAVVGAGDPLPFEKKPNLNAKIDGYQAAWPIRKDGSFGNWGIGPNLCRQLIAKGFVSVGEYDEKRKTWPLSYLSKTPREQLAAGVLEILSYDKKRNVVDLAFTAAGSRRIKTVWHRTRHDAGSGGSDLLSSFLGGRFFAFPKSLYAVQDCLSAIVRSKPDALVIDFFAGSGTTLHALCMLNAADQGRRRCVLVTNNEVDGETAGHLRALGHVPYDKEFQTHGIFERVTRPRCEAVVTGRKRDGSKVVGEYLDGRPYERGFEENSEFYKLKYLDPNDVSLGRQFEAILPLLWLTAGAVGDRPHVTPTKPWFSPKNSRFAILLDPDYFRNFVLKLSLRTDITHVWIVSDDEHAFARMRAELRRSLHVSMLYRDYLRNFIINTDRNV